MARKDDKAKNMYFIASGSKYARPIILEASLIPGLQD
jgi:hypothetical protein